MSVRPADCRQSPAARLRAALVVTLGSAGVISGPGQTPWEPAVLAQFTRPDVPATAAADLAAAQKWTPPATVPSRPGGGLARHPMLYAGEGCNVLFLVAGGEVVWTCFTGAGGEIDDVWLLSNGHILYTHQDHVAEITPQKNRVWRYDAPPGTEIHTAQPIGLDKVLFMQNGLPPKLIVLDKRTGRIEQERAMPAESLTDPRTVHPQFRRIRQTAAGTYLAPFLRMNKVVEYDREFREIWSYDTPAPWSAVRLANGNTLIVEDRQPVVREVSPAREIVWEFRATDVPLPGRVRKFQTAERLADGHTVIFCATGAVKAAEKPDYLQCIEVTPAKEVVWALQDWRQLGPATTAQLLDQPGVPEQPGSTNH